MKDAHSTVLGIALGLLFIGAYRRFFSAPKAKAAKSTPVALKITAYGKTRGSNLFVMKTGHA